MAEYIEREKVCEICGAKDIDGCSDECLIFMGNIPAADVAPVVRGRWLYKRCVVFDFTMDMYRCSECNTTWNAESNYCPHCGARMDGE